MSEYKFDTEAAFEMKKSQLEEQRGVSGCVGTWTGPGWYVCTSEAWGKDSSNLFFDSVETNVKNLKRSIEGTTARIAYLETLK